MCNNIACISYDKVGEYDEKMTPSQITERESLVTTRKRTLTVNDSKKTIKVKQPALSSSERRL